MSQLNLLFQHQCLRNTNNTSLNNVTGIQQSFDCCQPMQRAICDAVRNFLRDYPAAEPRSSVTTLGCWRYQTKQSSGDSLYSRYICSPLLHHRWRWPGLDPCGSRKIRRFYKADMQIFNHFIHFQNKQYYYCFTGIIFIYIILTKTCKILRYWYHNISMFIWSILLLYVLKQFWCQLPEDGEDNRAETCSRYVKDCTYKSQKCICWWYMSYSLSNNARKKKI